MKYAWIENDKIRDIAPGNPAELYHADIAKFYNTKVPDNAQNGDGWVNGKLVKPEVLPAVAQPEPVVIAPKVSPIEFKLLFTPQERIAIKSARATDVIIDDFFEIIEDTRLTHVDLNLESTKQAIQYIASKSLVEADRVVEILSGVFK